MGIVAFTPLPLPGQEAADAVEVARQLRDEGRHDEAIRVLRAYVATHPGDPGVHWLLAETLYWAGDRASALASFQSALGSAPTDPWLRVAFARFLVETGDASGAGEVLAPVLQDAGAPREAKAHGEALMGAAAYWSGDLGRATRHFEAALVLSPDHEDAGRQLEEIRTLTAPWVRMEGDLAGDNQPLSSARTSLEVGYRPTPLTRIAVKARGARLSSDPVSDRQLAVSGILGAAFPSASLEAELEGGFNSRGAVDGADWLGAARLGMGLPGSMTLRGSSERWSYVGTVASLGTAFTVRTLEIRLDRRDAPGWAGEAVLRRDRFPGGNRIHTRFAWILAPVVRGDRAGLRVGYSFAFQDSDSTTLSEVEVAGRGRGRGAAASGTTVTRYDPYYTPESLSSHSVLAELRWIPRADAFVSFNGSVAARATELAPHLVEIPGGAPEVAFAERSFTPWSLRAALEVPAGDHTTLRVHYEHSSTAFYDANRLGFAVNRILVSRAHDR